MIAKFVTPGEKEPQGFILTTILGIIGAVVATYLGQALGWYHAGEKAGFIGAIVGAVLLLLAWGFTAFAAHELIVRSKQSRGPLVLAPGL